MDASERFNNIADNFANSEVHRSSPTIRRLHDVLGNFDGIRLCDVACGAGHLALSFVNKASRLVGVDPAPNMLAAFRRLAEEKGVAVETKQAPANALPFTDGEFDLVCSRLAPHHFPELQKCVDEMVRVAAAGGHVAVIDLEGHSDARLDGINHQLEILHDPTHGRSHTSARWREVFSRAGLEILRHEAGLSERPEGVPVKRWCEIASSGNAAERAIREFLRHSTVEDLDALGIRIDGEEFLMPIRTTLIVGRKRDVCQ